MPLFVDAIAAMRKTPDQRTYADWSSPTIGGGSITLSDGLTASYSAIYRNQPWVYAAVNKIARNIARMPMKVYDGESNDRQRMRDGELPVLMKRPAAGVIPFRYKERMVKSVAIFGNGIAVKFGADGLPLRDESDTPVEMFPAPAIGWSLETGGGYIWTSRKGDTFRFKRWQIIHYRFEDPDANGFDSVFGMSMLEPLRVTLAMEDAARRYGLASFRNGARPSSILKTEQKLTPDGAERLKAGMMAIHGTSDNAFKLAVLEQGLDWAPWPVQNLDESALVEHRMLTRQEVAAVIDVPQPTIGILDESNFASIDMFHTMLYQDSLGPWVTMFEQTTQADLVDVTPAFEGLIVEFDMNSVMRGALSERVRAYATMITSGQKTLDEIRALENDPPMAGVQPEAGRLLIPLNMSGGTGAQLAEDSGAPDKASAFAQNGAVHA